MKKGNSDRNNGVFGEDNGSRYHLAREKVSIILRSLDIADDCRRGELLSIMEILFILGIIILCIILYPLFKRMYDLTKSGWKNELKINALKQIEENRKGVEKREDEAKFKNPEKWKKRNEKLKMQKMEIIDSFSKLINEIELCADEKPCPKCNELDVYIMSLSPNARSLLARCYHCQNEYRIKMNPDNPKEIIDLFNSFKNKLVSAAPYVKIGGESMMPYWHMDDKKA